LSQNEAGTRGAKWHTADTYCSPLVLAGELLKELARADEAKGGDLRSASRRGTPIEPSPYAQTLADTGLSRQTAHRYAGGPGA